MSDPFLGDNDTRGRLTSNLRIAGHDEDEDDYKLKVSQIGLICVIVTTTSSSIGSGANECCEHE
jgi:hypothetical protein